MAFQFVKASKKSARLRMALVGPAGSGKTYSALAVGTSLVPGGRVAVIDTEHGSASKYADEFGFDTLEIDSYAPKTYVEAIKAAEAARYDVIIVDSLSHAWVGKDGALEQKDNAAKRSQSGNTWTAWRDVTPQHNAMVEAILQCGAHVIVTMRAKTEYVQEKNAQGRTEIRKVGLAPVQRDGLDYEFDVVLDVTAEHDALVSKTRCKALAEKVFRYPGAELAATLRAWLTDGAAPVPKPAAEPERESTPPLVQSPAQVPDAVAAQWEKKLAGAKGSQLIEHAEKVAGVAEALRPRIWAAYVARWAALFAEYDDATAAAVVAKIDALPPALRSGADWTPVAAVRAARAAAREAAE